MTRTAGRRGDPAGFVAEIRRTVAEPPASIQVTASRQGRRIRVRVGDVGIYLVPDAAITLADRLVDATEQVERSRAYRETRRARPSPEHTDAPKSRHRAAEPQRGAMPGGLGSDAP